MKIYQIDYQEQTIISKFVSTPTVANLEFNQYLTEDSATKALEAYLKERTNNGTRSNS